MQGGKVCLMCGKPKAASAYYRSSSAYHKDGLIPICRNCIINAAYDSEVDGLDIDGFQTVLRQVDKPYNEKVLQSAERQTSKQYPTKTGIERVKTIVGLYFKNLNSLNQYQAATWDNSQFYEDTSPTGSGNSRQIVFVSDAERLFNKSLYTDRQNIYLKALYDLLSEMYQPTNQQQRNMLALYVKDCLILQNAIAYNDASIFDDCVSDIFDELTLLKNMLGGESNLEFADLLGDYKDNLQEN